MGKLVILGGERSNAVKFAKWPQYGVKEQEALNRVLNSGSWGTLGPEVKAFNKRFAEYSHCKYGISVTNGTVTLETIWRALGIGPGDEVILPPYTFNATASSIVYVGGIPVFCDIEEDTYNIDPNVLEALITPRTKAIAVVHVGGRCVDMDRVLAIADRHNLPVVEDAAHAPGSEWNGKRAGSMGAAGSFSFQASKNLTSGEGGFITTNREDLYERCFSIHHCGRAFRGGAWYDHPLIGTNARMTEWQAAILDAQMDVLDEQIEKRMANARYLTEQLRGLGFIGTSPDDPRITRNSYHLYVFRFLSEKCRGLSKATVQKALAAEGIPVAGGYVGLYHQSALMLEDTRRRTGTTTDYANLNLPQTEKAALEGMWFPHGVLLSDRAALDHIIESFRRVYDQADDLKKIATDN